MKVTIQGSPKEVAALVAALQERQFSSSIQGSKRHADDLVIKNDNCSKIVSRILVPNRGVR